MSKICISKIEFKNMFSYGNNWQSFKPDGISFITGYNNKTGRRNFTGKSNLLKVFQFALFGKVDGLTKSRIVNWKNRKNSECSIHFTKGNDKYVINRGIKPDILSVSCNGKDLPEPANKKDFQNQIENDILEMDFMSFMNIVYADTNNNVSILSMSKPNKRQFLENIFNLSYYTQLKDKANKKLKSIKDKVTSIDLTINQNNNRIDELKQERIKYNKAYGDVTDSNYIYEKKIKDKKNKEDQYNNDVINREKYREDKEHIEKSKSNINQLLVKIKYKIKECVKKINSDITEYIDVENIKIQIGIEQGEIERCEKHVKQEQSKIDKLNEDYPSVEDTKDKYLQQHTEAKTKLSQYEKQLKDAKSKLDNKTDEATCPTCYQSIDHSLLEETLKLDVEDMSNKVSEAKKSCDEYKQELSAVMGVISSIQKHNKNIDNMSTHTQKHNENIDNLNKKLSSAEEHNKTKDISDKYKKVASKLKSSYNHFNDKLNNIDNDILSLTKSIDSVNVSIEEYENMSGEIKQLEIDIKKEHEQRQQMKQWINDVDEKIDVVTNNIQSNNKSLKQLKNIKEYVEAIRNLCADEKAKQYTISNKVPLLNKRVNHYLSASGVNYYVKLDSWLECEIRGPGIKDASYNNLSGAERISLDRALQFAFHDINKLQSPTTMDLLVMDEIIGSNSLDYQGIRNIIDVVKTKQIEGNYNILLISHDENVKEADNIIDNYYTILSDGKYSYITSDKGE